MIMKLFDLLKKEELHLFEINNYCSSEVIFHEHDLCDVVGYVIEGNVNIVSYGKNGEERIISQIFKGQFFANALIFSKNPYYLGEIIAGKNTSIAFISKENLIKLLQINKDFLSFYLNLMSEKTIYLNTRSKLLAHKNIRERILYYLEMNNGEVKSNITILSKEIILPRPSVSREIQRMIDDKLIIKNKKSIKLK